MSVLIKGMDMPKNCCGCPCGRVDGATKDPMNNEIFNMFCMAKKDYWTCYRKVSGKPTWCPLVEVKTPHGKLIDVSKISSTVGYYSLSNGKTLRKHFYEIEYIHNAPTVIEAEE